MNIKILLPLALFLLAGAASCEKTRAKTTSVAADISVLLPIDKTQSEDSEALIQFAPELKTALTACETCREIIVVRFGSNGKGVWNATSKKFLVPKKPASTFNEAQEAAVRAEANEKCTPRRICEDNLVAEAKARFEKEASARLAHYEQEHTQVINDVMAQVLQRAAKEPPCSDIGDMASYIAQAPASHVLWMTDGAHNCASKLKAQKFKHKVFLGLLPLAIEPNGGLPSRQETLLKIYPNATIQAAATINSNILAAFFREQLP